MMRTVLPMAVLLLALGCDAERLPPAQPITVQIENRGLRSTFVTGDRMPFRIHNGASGPWRPQAARAPLCSECDDVCNSDMHGDPAPYWLEIAAGQSVSFDWDGRLYRLRQDGCGCGWSCFSVEALEAGSYDLVLELEPALPASGEPYTRHDVDGLVYWRAGRFGYADPRQDRRFKVDLQGQSTVTLTLAD